MKYDASSSVLFSQYCLRHLGFVVVPYQFYDCFSISVKNIIGIFTGIALNMQMTLTRMGILTILIIPIHYHGLSSHLFVSSVSFINVL